MSRTVKSRIQKLESKTAARTGWDWRTDVYPQLRPYTDPQVMEKLGLTQRDFAELGWVFAWNRKDCLMEIGCDGFPIYETSEAYLRRKFKEAFGCDPPSKFLGKYTIAEP
jgi:hypothetical protein